MEGRLDVAMFCDVWKIGRFQCLFVASFVVIMYYHVWKIRRIQVCIYGLVSWLPHQEAVQRRCSLQQKCLIGDCLAAKMPHICLYIKGGLLPQDCFFPHGDLSPSPDGSVPSPD
jgi:hypothetical protein